MLKRHWLAFLAAAAALAAVLLWGWNVRNNDLELAMAEQCGTARHLAGAVEGSIAAQISRGCIDVERAQAVLSGIREATGLKQLHLHQGESPLADCCDGHALPPGVHGREGRFLAEDIFYYWQPIRLDAPKLNCGGGGGRGPAWRRAGQTAPVSGNPVLLVIMGMPAETLRLRTAAADSRFLLLAACALFTALAFTAAWLRHAERQTLRRRLGELESQKARLEELQLIAAGVAHETKNPLGIIRGMAQRMRSAAGLPPGVPEMAEKIMDEADVTAERLAEFLNFARLREPKPQPVSAAGVLGSVCGVLRPDFEEAGIALQLECPPDAVFEADADLLSQIVVNLLTNSLNACPAGAAVRLALQIQGDGASLLVEDNGRGIEPGLLKDIFKPYVSGRSGGHGIGLSMVRRLAEAMGWRVEAASEAGKGTIMTIHGIRVPRP